MVTGTGQTVGGEVKRNRQVFVLLDSGLEPLLTMLGELIVSQKWDGKRDVWLRWGEVAVLEGLVDDVECPTASGLFEVGCHASYGVDLQVSMFAATQLLGCFKGCSGVFGEVAKECERM